MTLPRPGRFLAVLAFAPLLSCHCKTHVGPSGACAQEADNQPDHLGTCSGDPDCSDHYKCKTPKDNASVQCCLFENRSCNTEADCCPGQTCTPQKTCFDKFLDCTQGGNAACGNPDGGGDMVCVVYSDHYETYHRCEFQACDSLGHCPQPSQSCFQGQCMSTLPCNGTCPAGDGCVPEAAQGGYCQKFACPMSCKPGFIATFSDNIHIWDTCNLAAETCACVELPPLRSNDLGRFSGLSTDGASNVLVSMYDGQYGDLVVDKFDATGTLVKQQWVDGVPATGTVVYGPSGPRGGITDPGPDVGRYSDVVVHGQFAYVSYYESNPAMGGNLRFAVRQPDGLTWKTMQVDGTTGDVGLYTSVAVDSDGFPAISYWQRGGKPGFDATACPAWYSNGGPLAFITALKFVRATKTNPASSADFGAPVILDCQDRPVPLCYGCAGVCADPGTGPACYTAGTGCSGCDPNTQVCVQSGTSADGGPGSVCANKYNPSLLADIPEGTGLFTSLDFQGKNAFIAYQIRAAATGSLWGVSLDQTDTPALPVLLDATDDTGYFPSLKIHPTSQQVMVSYQDWSTKALLFYVGTGFNAGQTPEVIDTGAGAVGSGVSAWEGASSTLAVAPNGDVYAAYEDTTNNDLKLAVRKPTWTILNPLHTAGAVGFFADGAFLGKTLFVSSARLHAKPDPNAPGGASLDNTLVLDSFTPP